MSYNNSFWEQGSFLDPYDLIIVGAGIVGLSSALFYKRAHPAARVMVLERGFLPKGASTRNAGFACVGSIGEHQADIKKESEDIVKERIVRRYRGLERLKEVLGEEAIGYRHCGGYEFFTSEEAFKEVSSEVGRFNKWMEELIGEEQVYSLDRKEGYPVICNRLEGALHPGKMMQYLAQKVAATGIDIKWNTEVEQTTEDGTVHVAGGPTLKAKQILHAANGFVARLVPSLTVSPARGLVFVTNEQKELPWKGIFHHDRGYIYFRNVGQRLLIGGARNVDKKQEETDQFGANSKIKNHLVDFVDEELRLQEGWTIQHQWSGIMGFTTTKSPIVEQVDQYRYVAAGLSGMGIAIGMDVAEQAVEML
ncbi:NAD(P)/FAD-dependent oxidoreductase [Fodinibius halophilus]|uniref:FAD-binding oxidoreductase n=1 Tax=Fodinibius halophilus TaxID=1736908 RepID=A0A6M1T227_9BACT|nr:FAD-dependent oxidoreductase [Fodinibius halophilus]NGP89526.1 FAD-binding oxidoreductase [Fodinibius halophilus]